MITRHSAIALLVVAAGATRGGVAQDSVPRFERAECDFPLPSAYPPDLKRECGFLVVPEVRGRQTGRSFRLAVVRYPAREPDGSPPLVLLQGGPGGTNSPGATRFVWTEMQFPLVRRRDVITFDYRGVGASEPHLCPDFNLRPLLDRPSQREWEEQYRAAVRACVATLDAQGLDRSAYGADVNAADAIDLRRALGYASWDLYGVSYGGVVAIELARRDSAATHAVVLGSSGGPGTRYAAEVALVHQQFVQRVAAACAAQPPCHAAFPDVAADFDSLSRQFARAPVTIPLPDGAGNVVLNVERFVRAAARIGSPADIARLPLLLHQLRGADRAAALGRLAARGGFSFWEPAAHLVWCNEYGSTYAAGVATVRPKLQPAFRAVVDDFREHCDLWLPRPTHELDVRPLANAIPTLILHGEYDGTDVAATQRRLTARLVHAYAYVLRGESHANPPVGCHGVIMQQFLEHPERAPDVACLQRMPAIRFRTSGFNPMATIDVTPSPGASTPFAGTWEVPLGGGPDWFFALDTDGRAVRGWELGQQLPIIDGRIEGSTLRFSVKTSDGSRTITFSGALQGDSIAFTRDIIIAPGGSPGGRGLLGAAGPSTFIARRVR